MIGYMGSHKYERQEFIDSIEDALDFGAYYFTIAFPRETREKSMQDFVSKVLPNYS
jgi:hypothetical protein